MAELSRPPVPAGSYPVVVVGSGPGGLQVSYCLSRLGVDHAVLSADDAPGGMFRRWPFFQRLLSWTKPYAPVAATGSRPTSATTGTASSPTSPRTGRSCRTSWTGPRTSRRGRRWRPNLETFADADRDSESATAAAGRRRGARPAADGDTFVLETTDGEYRAQVARSSRSASPSRTCPQTPGIELAAHYADTRPAETYADKRVFIIGKQNSGFELASGLLQWARRIVLASPSPAKLSVNTRSLVGVRARYVQPFEDHVLGGGVAILDAAIEGIERLADAARSRSGPDRPRAATSSRSRSTR